MLLGYAPLLSQQPTPGDPPPTTVLTGCLRSTGADTAIAGPSGRLYTLEVTETAATPAATTATGSATPAVSKITYSLSVPTSIDFEKHADHEVALTGRLQAATPSTASRPGTPAQPAKPGGAHRTFEVTELKMIAAKCK